VVCWTGGAGDLLCVAESGEGEEGGESGELGGEHCELWNEVALK
jgi:hypothetical protein